MLKKQNKKNNKSKKKLYRRNQQINSFTMSLMKIQKMSKNYNQEKLFLLLHQNQIQDLEAEKSVKLNNLKLKKLKILILINDLIKRKVKIKEAKFFKTASLKTIN